MKPSIILFMVLAVVVTVNKDLAIAQDQEFKAGDKVAVFTDDGRFKPGVIVSGPDFKRFYRVKLTEVSTGETEEVAVPAGRIRGPGQSGNSNKGQSQGDSNSGRMGDGQSQSDSGEEVEVALRNGEVVTGHVVTVMRGSGGVVVRYTDPSTGQKISRPFPRSHVRKPKKGTKKPEVTQPVLRTWQAKNGKYSIKAKFISADDTKVKLEKDNGDMAEVEIKLLSSDDQTYIRKMSNTKQPSTGGAVVATKTADFSKAKRLSAARVTGSFTPDSINPAELVDAVKVQIPDRNQFGADIEKLMLSSDGNIAMIVCSSGVMDQKNTRLEMVNLKENKSIGAFPFPSSTGVPFGIGSDDKTLFSLTEKNVNVAATQIDVWQLKSGKISHQKNVVLGSGFKDGGGMAGPMGGAGPRSRFGGMGGFNAQQRDKPQSVGVVNDNTVFVQTMTELFLVDVQTGQVIFSDEIFGFDPPALSANRKYMAFYPRTGKKIVILDCQSLQVTNTIAAPDVDDLVFSNDGNRLACVTRQFENQAVQLYDIKTGELLNEVSIPFDPRGAFWSGDSYVVLDDMDKRTIIDVEKGYPVAHWRVIFNKDQNFIRLGGTNVLRTVNTTNGNFVQSVELPDPVWVDPNPDLNKFYVMLNGNDIAIDLSGTGFGAGEKSLIQKALTSQIQEAGGRVAGSARIEIVASTKKGNPKSTKYQSRNPRGEAQEHNITFTPYVNELKIFEDGKEIWQIDMLSGGPTVNSGTLEEIQRSADQNSKPSLEFFARPNSIPKKVPRKNAWENNVQTYTTQY